MKIKKIIKEDNNKLNTIIQYFTNAQILEIMKQTLTENDYYKFIKNSIDEEINNDSFEDYLQNNISKNKLLELINLFDINIYDKIISQMINTLY